MITKVQKNLKKIIGDLTAAKEQCLIAAVSGGADSVCLLLVLHELKQSMNFSLEVIHVEHGIRGEESLQDAKFVEKLCKDLSVICHTVHVDVPAYCANTGIGTEEAARILRYNAMKEYASARDGMIVLAHHMEDNAETVLFQMLRGSSITGMGGIRPIRKDENGVVYLRPLLNIHRYEIEEYLQSKKQDYCTDSTNLTTEYQRNYIRQEIMPRLCDVNSAAVEHIAQTARHMGEVKDFLDHERNRAMERVAVITGEGVQLQVCGLQELHPVLQKEVMYESISLVAEGKKDISSVHVEDALKLLDAQSGKQVTLPYGILAQKSFDKLIIRKETDLKEEKQTFVVSEEMLKAWKESGREEEIILSGLAEKFLFHVFPYNGNDAEIPKKSYTKWFDYDKIIKGFCIRTRENGDFLISDDCGHRKKLKNYFIDEKIPQKDRNSMWILAQDSLVLWLVGGRISEHAKVTEDTKTVIQIQFIGGK